MRRIEVLLACHHGEPVWIFGKGPSLDHFDFSQAGEVRICINESVRAVPNPKYFFAHDEGPISNVAEDWPDQCKAILQPERATYAESCGVPADLLYVYSKRYCDNHVRDMEPSEIARHNALYGNSGTVHCAIHFCRLIGAAKVVLVGFDGSGGYAANIRLPDGGAQHERIRRDSISLLKTLGLPYEIFQPNLTA